MKTKQNGASVVARPGRKSHTAESDRVNDLLLAQQEPVEGSQNEFLDEEEETSAVDEEEIAPGEAAVPAEEVDAGSSHAADDSLGLYLRQMGAIPLLNREQELTLARRLERQRTRDR